LSTIRKLAGQTVIYGLSSIVARIVNFFLVPIYTRVLSPGNYGLASEMLAYIAIFQVILTFGLETGYFRFANKHREQSDSVFSTALIWLGSTSTLFLLLILVFSGYLGRLMGHPSQYVIYVGLILALDCFTAVLFARLRFENRPWKFAFFRSLKIISEVAFNILLLYGLPKYFRHHPDSFLLNIVPATPDYGYILLAIFLSCIVALILFLPQLLRIKLSYSKSQSKLLLAYSLPLMIAGLPGVANDMLSRIFFRFFAPVSQPWQDQLGIFNANAKLAVFMVLFVQMFRYAAEPFFFSTAQKENMKQQYADVMKYFVAFCSLIFLSIALYTDLFALILGRDFRSGIVILPIMLVANVLLGIAFNLSMWYKLSEQTQYAVWITLSGLMVTVVINVLFMPRYGYMAAAWGYLFSYLVMVLISAVLGNKFYPIPYDWTRISLYLGIAVIIFLLSSWIAPDDRFYRLIINSFLLGVYLVTLFLFEKSLLVSSFKSIKISVLRRLKEKI
jgi:O-antigen/teichoic acid export membrane protein